jgi:hypothetical protein
VSQLLSADGSVSVHIDSQTNSVLRFYVNQSRELPFAGNFTTPGGYMWTYQLSRLCKIALALVCTCLFVFTLAACQDNGRTPVNSVKKTPLAYGVRQNNTPTPATTSTPTTKFNPGSQFYFAMGSEANGALRAPLVQQAPVKMLTSWYNRRSDLAWITKWQSSYIPSLYAQGYALQLVVWDGGDPRVNFNTAYGPACGIPYPVSSQFLQDMVSLAKTFRGSGPLYVSLFAEFSTYTCVNNHWVGNENYYMALKDQYRAALEIFHRYAPNSRVSICWGSWLSRYDNPSVLSGRSFINKFSDIMSISDFQSFQSMESDSNVDDVLDMTRILHQWGKVLLSYYWSPPATFNADVHTMFTDSYMANVMANGLFGFGFMTNTDLSSSNSPLPFVVNAVKRYARS